MKKQKISFCAIQALPHTNISSSYILSTSKPCYSRPSCGIFVSHMVNTRVYTCKSTQ